jgi:hypothetical protein
LIERVCCPTIIARMISWLRPSLYSPYNINVLPTFHFHCWILIL